MAVRAAFMVLALTTAAFPRGACAQDDPVQSDPACAKYQEPLAYNACLASHGPKASDVGESRAQDLPGRAAPAPSAVASPAPRVQRWPSTATRRHGRVHMEFRVR
jgi:hypothetical protein